MLVAHTYVSSRDEWSDSAIVDRFLSTFEGECLAQHWFASRCHPRLSQFRYIEGWNNPHRRHSARGHHSPVALE